MKNIIIALGVLIIIAGIYFAFSTKDTTEVIDIDVEETEVVPPTTVPTSTPEVVETDDHETVIGTSVEGNDIVAYHYGDGETEVLLVGGIHGGYEWNTVLLAYELMDYAEANPSWIPEPVTLTVIPTLNPDGLRAVTGKLGRFVRSDIASDEDTVVSGRFNANDVDLNRNFDCDWNARGTWQNRAVSGGAQAFSEPESSAIRDYVRSNEPEKVVVFYSAAGGVYSSSCHNGVLPETEKMTSDYAKASGYIAYPDFDYYEITGDMVNWLAREKVPAISVLLTNHTDTEFEKNRAGVGALLEEYTDR